MQVPKVVASISEVDAAPGQRRSYGQAWYFGNREFSYRQRDLVKRIVVGGMRRLVNCCASVLEGRHARDRQRHCLEPFVGLDPQMQQLSFPGQGETARAKLSHQFEVPLVEVVAQAHRIPFSAGRTQFWTSNLVRACVKEANNFKQQLTDWFRDGAPIGVGRPISESGIFPKEHDKGSFRRSCLSLYVWSGGHTNDVRVRENQQGTEAELAKLVNMVTLSSTTRWKPSLQCTQVLSLSWHHRDANHCRHWRSGLHEFSVNERIFLPRIRDVVKDLISLLAQSGQEEDEVDSAVVDSVDAYRTTSLPPKKTKTSSQCRL